MVEKVYYFDTESYDYFGGQKNDSEEFSSIKEAMEEQRLSKKLDYNFGDGYRKTFEISSYWRYRKLSHFFHGKRLGYKPTKPEKFVFNADDEPILI